MSHIFVKRYLSQVTAILFVMETCSLGRDMCYLSACVFDQVPLYFTAPCGSAYVAIESSPRSSK